ncbi:MAG: putative toxin-antitoxin system toxin component, PIN family [Phycisphaerales bacterium]|nr:putative toxin-antitoxin system toxin component, PIN family [Phycisphaerales bacterium]
MRPRIIIDTNVLVAALKSRQGASFRVLSLVGTGRFDLALSVPLFTQYEDVVARQDEVPAKAIKNILDYLVKVAELHEIFFLWRPILDDPGDDLVLEIAAQSNSDFIVTFNVRHFKQAHQFGIRPLRPLEFLKEIGDMT